MFRGGNYRNAFRNRFFLHELTKLIVLEDLLSEVYILVSKLGFAYSDVKEMSKLERLYYINLYIMEKEAEADANKQHSSRR